MKKQSNQSSENNKEKPINRRKVLITIGNSVSGIVGFGTIGVMYKFLSPNVILEPPTRFQIGTPDNFQPNTVIFDEEHHLFIIRNEQGQFYTLSSICTHLGCTINWRPVIDPANPEGIISCPCHGSIYDKTGHVVSGPAPRSLDKYRMILKNGRLMIDTNEIVSEEDMFLEL